MCSNLRKNDCRRRSQMEATLTDTCTVYRRTSGLDEFRTDGATETLVAEYPCRSTVSSKPSNLELGSEDVVRAQWEVMLPLSAAVDDLCIIVVNDARLVVLDTDAGRTNALLLTARCRKDV